jgi:transposase
MEQLLMSRKERERVVVLSRVKDKQLSRSAAARTLGLSLRHLHRIYRRYLADGDAGLVHRSRGRASPRRIDAEEHQKAIALYRSTYRSFGPTLFAEKLAEDHGIWISHDTAWRWLRAEGLLEQFRRGRRSRRRRPRRERFGQMVQMDGSHHRWFENRGGACCLMVTIDDATGRMQGRFYGGETLAAAMDVTRRWCERFGIPQSLYVDRAGIYRCDREPTVEELKARKTPATQFGRAMKELDVRLILANSPQAKGRVERANGTLQDRLVKEMRLAGIAGVEQANTWLESSQFFDRLSKKFGVAPMDAADAHRPVVMNLGEVLCVKEKRSVGNDGCVSWKGRVLQLKSARAGLRQVEVWERLDGTLTLVDGGGALAYEPWKEQPRARPEIRNNRVYKPGQHQQLRLNPGRPRRPIEPPPRLQKVG